MDLSELIKCYNMEHKSLFTAFAVSFPVLFTVLYLYKTLVCQLGVL